MTSFPLVTIYTCVYNGARTLHRVFNSVKNLDYPNIEHVIVNDGSTDDTDAMIQAYITEVSIPVKYHKKENGGKHTALNIAWDIAEGEFLVQLDADDELLPHAVTFLVETYFRIPEDIRNEYWCVHGRCITQHGDFVGDKYPENINAQHWSKALEAANKCSGEKIGLQVRAYLKDYRFPEVVGLSYISEGMLWKQIERNYGTWYTNEVIRIYYVGEGGNLTARKTQRRHFAPLCYKMKWQLMHPEWYKTSFRDLVRYSLTYFISDRKFRDNNRYTEGLETHKIALILLCPFTLVGAYFARLIKHIR